MKLRSTSRLPPKIERPEKVKATMNPRREQQALTENFGVSFFKQKSAATSTYMKSAAIEDAAEAKTPISNQT